MSQKNETFHKTEATGFYKSHDGVLINKDNDALVAYKQRKIKEQRLSNMIDEVDTIKNDIAEIKELLKGLVK